MNSLNQKWPFFSVNNSDGMALFTDKLELIQSNEIYHSVLSLLNLSHELSKTLKYAYVQHKNGDFILKPDKERYIICDYSTVKWNSGTFVILKIGLYINEIKIVFDFDWIGQHKSVLFFNFEGKFYASLAFIQEIDQSVRLRKPIDILQLIHPLHQQRINKEFMLWAKSDSKESDFYFDIANAYGQIKEVTVKVSKRKYNGDDIFACFIEYKSLEKNRLEEIYLQKQATKKILESISEIYWEYEPVSGIFWISRTLSGIIVPQYKKLRLFHLFRIIHAGDFQKIRLIIERVKEGISPRFHVEVRMLQPNGLYSWFLLKGEIEYAKDLSPAIIRGSILPIDYYIREKQAYHELQNSIKNFIQAHQAPMAIFGRTNESNFWHEATLFVHNQAFADLVKLDADNVDEPNPELKLFLKRLSVEERILESEQFIFENREIWLIKLNKYFVFFIYRNQSISNVSDQFSITDNLYNSFEIKRKVIFNREKDILNTVPASFILLNKEFRIKVFNREAQKLLNQISEHAVREMNLLEDYFQGEQIVVLNHFFKSALKGKEKSGEFELIKLHGERFWLQIQFKPVWLDSRQIDLVAFMAHDISNYKKLENLLINAKDKAETADRLKTEFVSNMSHEIRTPMNAIVGFSELLSMEISNPEHLEYLGIIIDSGQQLLALIEEIIDISKIESGEVTLKESTQNLNKILLELHHLFKNELIRRKKEQVRLLLSRGLSERQAEVYIDEQKLKQVLSNLINNAIKFTHQGFIEFGTELLPDAKAIRFYVKDTGIGISNKQKEYIFQRFAQADGSIKRKYGGTGLGLTISAALVEIMGGKLSVDSTENLGSYFSFELPYKSTHQSGSYLLLDDNITKDWSGYQMLIYSDDHKLISKIKENFVSNRLRIFTSSTPDTALEILQNQSKIDFFLFHCTPFSKELLQFISKTKHHFKTICIFNDASDSEMQFFLEYKIDDFCLKTKIESTLSQVLIKYIQNE